MDPPFLPQGAKRLISGMPMRRSCRAMPFVSLVIALGVLLLGLPVGGVQYVNDELLWTKQAWNEHKLDFPWQFFAKQREPVLARLLEADDYVRTSLSGPLGDIRAEIERDSKRCRRWGPRDRPDQQRGQECLTAVEVEWSCDCLKLPSSSCCPQQPTPGRLALLAGA